MSKSFEQAPKEQSENLSKVESFGNPAFERFAADVGAMIEQIDGEQIKKLMDSRFDGVSGRSGVIEGKAGDSNYEVSLPPTDPNQGFVGFITLQKEQGEKFEAVVKAQGESMRDTVKDYLEAVAEKPVIKEMTPEIYGVYGNWAVIEKLEGVETQKLQQLLESDEVFRNKYVESTYELLKKAARERLDLQDVAFRDGHNIMADPKSGDVKLMELGNIRRDGLSREPDELITEHLIDEIRAVAGPEAEHYKQEYVYKLTCRILQDSDEDELYSRPRGYSIDHPRFLKHYNFYMMQSSIGHHEEAMTEETRQKLAANPEVKKKIMAPIGFDAGYHAKVIHPDLIDSAKAGNREEFIRHLQERKSMVRISNSDDPRVERVFID